MYLNAPIKIGFCSVASTCNALCSLLGHLGVLALCREQRPGVIWIGQKEYISPTRNSLALYKEKLLGLIQREAPWPYPRRN